MNRVNPAKLLNSKWSALHPRRRERHFVVTRLIRGADGAVDACEIEAVINRRCYRIDWRELKDDEAWAFGWQ